MSRKTTNIIVTLMMLSLLFITLGAAQVLPLRVKLTSTRAAIFGNSTQARFMHRVYEAQIRRAKNNGRTYFAGLREDQLEKVDKERKMRKDAAEQCKSLIKHAKSDLKRQKEERSREALKVSNIGIYSAYRSVEHDELAWRNAFKKHFTATKNNRAKLRGGEYGDEALELMITRMRQFKAAPGFSRHTSGVAVDFKTTENNVTLTADSNQNNLWKKTWFHKWLVKNAKNFKFKPLATEAWHWEYSK